MKKINRIVVALSRTQPDVGLLAYAAMVSKLLSPSLIEFVHVVPDEGKIEDFMLNRMQDEVEYHFTRPIDGPEVTYRIVVGNVLDQLVEYAANHQTELILLGHRKGRTGRRSLSSRLSMVAPCPVWMVPEGAGIGVHHVLVPVDFSNHSGLALEHAAVIAKAAKAEGTAFHVNFDASGFQYEENAKESHDVENERMAEIMLRIDSYGVRIGSSFEVSAKPAQAIVRKRAELNADLIVMGTRGRTPAAALLLGSVAAETIVETPVPILVVKQFGAKMGVLDALLKRETWVAEERSSQA